MFRKISSSISCLRLMSPEPFEFFLDIIHSSFHCFCVVTLPPSTSRTLSLYPSSSWKVNDVLNWKTNKTSRTPDFNHFLSMCILLSGIKILKRLALYCSFKTCCSMICEAKRSFLSASAHRLANWAYFNLIAFHLEHFLQSII